ncbi:MAG: hypothetical protein MJZ11_13160 [Lachnospiraceae bacterium]|nr:hypothetical protein [Lachnospiraceae bacterium]
MIKELTYKQIYLIAIAVTSLLAVCAYLFSFKNTINIITQYIELQERINAIKDAPEKITVLNAKMSQIDHLLIDKDDIDVEQIILDKTTKFCKNNSLTLIEFPQTSYSEYQDYQILTNKVVLEGNFISIVKFIHDSERINKTGMVAAVQLTKKKDLQTKKEHLFSYIYFQNIKSKSNN